MAAEAAGSGGDERRQRSDFEGGIESPSRCVARARTHLAAQSEALVRVPRGIVAAQCKCDAIHNTSMYVLTFVLSKIVFASTYSMDLLQAGILPKVGPSC